jgi:hypothetical protein
VAALEPEVLGLSYSGCLISNRAVTPFLIVCGDAGCVSRSLARSLNLLSEPDVMRIICNQLTDWIDDLEASQTFAHT